MNRVKDKTVIVTGAALGIGRATSELLAREGAAVKKRFGRIDVLVNNAGVAGADKPTAEVTEEEWDKVMDVNVKGVFLCTKHAVPAMREAGGGSVINLSSIYGVLYLASDESKFVTGSELVIDGGYTAR